MQQRRSRSLGAGHPAVVVVAKLTGEAHAPPGQPIDRLRAAGDGQRRAGRDFVEDVVGRLVLEACRAAQVENLCVPNLVANLERRFRRRRRRRRVRHWRRLRHLWSRGRQQRHPAWRRARHPACKLLAVDCAAQLPPVQPVGHLWAGQDDTGGCYGQSGQHIVARLAAIARAAAHISFAGHIDGLADGKGWRNHCFAPAVIVLHGLAPVLDHALPPLDHPAVYRRPAVEDQRPDLLIARLAIPVVDLAIGALDPAIVLVQPGHVLVSLGDVDRQVAHARRRSIHKVTVGPEVILPVLKRRGHVGVGIDL